MKNSSDNNNTRDDTTPRSIYTLADNELVSIDWVALLEALRFLDCSANRISVLATFARALADPPRLAEVIAEGNPVSRAEGWANFSVDENSPQIVPSSLQYPFLRYLF